MPTGAGKSLDVETRLSVARTFLFVPADRPDRITKALKSGADAVIVDLEDAVRAENRELARTFLRRLVDVAPNPRESILVVRVNPIRTSDFAPDLQAAFDSGAACIMLPKFIPGQTATEIDAALAVLEASYGRASRMPVIGLIESAAGVLALSGSAVLPTRLIRLAFGAADLQADLKITYQTKNIHTDFAMALIVLASAAAGLPAPLDSPHFGLADESGLADSVRRAREGGFGGKLCIHPNQLEIVHTGFGVTEVEQQWAREVLEHWSDSANRGVGAIRVEDEFVDEAVVRRARQILELQ